MKGRWSFSDVVAWFFEKTGTKAEMEFQPTFEKASLPAVGGKVSDFTAKLDDLGVTQYVTTLIGTWLQEVITGTISPTTLKGLYGSDFFQ